MKHRKIRGWSGKIYYGLTEVTLPFEKEEECPLRSHLGKLPCCSSFLELYI
jgi:hypothetical protein